MAWFASGLAAGFVQDARPMPADRYRHQFQAAGGRFMSLIRSKKTSLCSYRRYFLVSEDDVAPGDNLDVIQRKINLAARKPGFVNKPFRRGN